MIRGRRGGDPRPQRVPGGDSGPEAGQDPSWAQDAALAQRALVDAEAFGDLYDKYCDGIYRFVARRLNDRETAEDLTSEIFFKALRGIEGYQPTKAPFAAWLYRIATNTVIDHLRARRPTASLEVLAETPDAAHQVEWQAIDRVEADRVWAAVERLPEARRTAVTLRLGNDLPIAEIAARLGRSEGAIKALLNRGLTAVRMSLQSTVGGERAET